MNTRTSWSLSIRTYRSSQPTRRHIHRLTSISVLFALSFLVAVVVLTWYLYDSIYLRYVLLFMGVTSSTYAIRDACEQGLVSGKYQRKKDGCDCHLMAEQYNRGKPVSVVPICTISGAWRWKLMSQDNRQRTARCMCHPYCRRGQRYHTDSIYRLRTVVVLHSAHCYRTSNHYRSRLYPIYSPRTSRTIPTLCS